MPFSVKNTITGTTKWFLTFPIIKTITLNPIYTAVVIVVITMLIVGAVIWATDDMPLWRMLVCAGFYALFPTIGLVFLHNHQLMEELKEKQLSGGYDGVFNSIDRISETPSINDLIPVKIGMVTPAK